MARDRTCILCETVYVSKQEMDEHMRSMLHHRELEKLKGRDCGHECRVCKVKVVSLTDYASHISSPTHKQNVEAADKKNVGNNHDEHYFDHALVDLIEKRNENIRKEKEAAAAKLAKEKEEQRKKEDFLQRLKDVKERYRLDHVWQPPFQGFSGPNHQYTWYRGNRNNVSTGEARPWDYNRQGKSATWHAQEPPNLQKWASEEFSSRKRDYQVEQSNRTWGHVPYSGNKQSRLPWLSSGGSSNGLYGQNNFSKYPPKARPQSFVGFPTPPSFFSQAVNQFQSAGNDRGNQQDAGLQHGEAAFESDPNSSKNSKTFGSNPKLDKSCRWSPYPVTSGSHGDAHTSPSEKYHKVPKPQNQERAPEVNRQSKPEQRQRQVMPNRKNEEESGKHQTKPKPTPTDGSCSKGSSSQRDGHLNSSSGSSGQRPNKPLLHVAQKSSSAPAVGGGALLSKASGQAVSQPKPPGNQGGLKSPPVGLLQSRQERHLPESAKTARHNVLEKRGSLDSSNNNRGEMVWHSVEEQQTDQGQSQTGVSRSQNAAKPALTDAAKPEKPSSDSSQFLQSLQVSTSVMESSEPAASLRDDEENKKKAKKQTCPALPDEATLVAEAGQSSESDASKSGEAQTGSGSNTSSLSKLDLPPVFKRDLTKHISSKSKAGGHEPNLNIARRVRNLSESRRSDTEKDSGLKPTVRQLISSSGSRRNVNWEQVYQEVRKKQDKGKGMPRFGIEMVPCEQEYQSQEEEDVALLEGFHWESLMDISAQGTSRKRSLSESSLAPGSTPSLFSSLSSEEKTQRKGLSSEQQSSVASPSCTSAERNPDYQRPTETKLQRQPDKLTSATVKVLQRSDSVLGDSSSGTDLHDGQGTGKRRRAAGDVPSKEASSLEHNSKRMKVKSKRERLQIDQLLAVSLREEELSRSLQNVDTSLIQARAALEAAYMEVQRLMVVKQQVTVEMSTLRNKRIELLKGMQGTVEEAPLLKLKEEKMDSFETEPHTPSSVTCPSVSDTAVRSPNHAADCASPPSSSLPSMPVVIKEEPQSPVHISSEVDAVDGATDRAHSSTPELPVAHATTSPDPTQNHRSSREIKYEPCQTNCEELADYQGTSPGLPETTEQAVQASNNYNNHLSDSKPLIKLSPSRRSSEVGSVGDWADIQSTQSSAVLNMPASPSAGGGRRVRKLKKRKALKKAQGTEQPETSETEMDEEASRPRWLRQRRRPSGGSQVSTSSVPADDREGSMITEDSKKPESLKNMVELPHAAPADGMGNLEKEESMEVTAACQQPQMDVLVPAPPPALPPGLVPDSPKLQPQSLACNEVSSTSDMDLCKSSESDLPSAITLPKTSSDVSSDHGEDEMPTGGMFDGHQEAVNAMQIHNGQLYTCSGDRTIKAFDLVSHQCVGVFEGHSSKVTCLLVSAAPCLHHRLYSGSSDQTIRCYSLKTQEFEQQFSLSDRVLCLHSRWKTLYAGLANGTVVTFNLKTNKQMDVFDCHGPRAVSCLASLQEGARKILLVGSYDSTISVREAKSGVLLRTLQGHTKSVLCMKVVNDLVFSGSSDHSVYAHNIHTGELVQAFKGHSHAVTVVAVLGKMMVTACLDKLVRVYDIQTQDQVQVYGGHKDMVLCMSVHKNMIYTGCYDGSVQAVKLNLIQNYRCWWHGCSLVFGMTAHLLQHLVNDHANGNFQKCRWKNCEEFFCARNSSKQMMLLHMQKHAEEETEAEP